MFLNGRQFNNNQICKQSIELFCNNVIIIPVAHPFLINMKIILVAQHALPVLFLGFILNFMINCIIYRKNTFISDKTTISKHKNLLTYAHAFVVTNPPPPKKNRRGGGWSFAIITSRKISV